MANTNQHPHVIKYPEALTMWNTKIPKEDFLKIINPGDFPKQRIIDGLGISGSPLISSFGITDAKEISERQSIMRFLTESPEIDAWIRDGNIPFDLPRNEYEFLRYFDPNNEHTPYWNNVRKLTNMLSRYALLPNRIETLLKSIRNSLVLEEDEKIMAQFITDRITNIAVIEGMMDFNVKLGWCIQESEQDDQEDDKEPKERIEPTTITTNGGDPHVHGHRMYSFAVESAANHAYPEWTKQKFNPLNWIGINRFANWITDLRNKSERSKAYNEMVIDKASSGLILDIKTEVEKQLRILNWNKELADKHIVVRVYFSYSNLGLRIKIYGIDYYVEMPEVRFEFGEYKGYSAEKLTSIRQAMQKQVDYMSNYCRSRVSAKLLLKIEKQDPNFFSNTIEAPSPNTDSEHRWFALANLYTNPIIKEIYEEALRHRKFLQEQMKMLRSIAELGFKLRQKASELNTPMCFPDIVDAKSHVVAFNELYPIHLLSQLNGKKPVPIRDLAPINGQVIGFTGYHGGGKTVAALSISDNIYLAQSGLPIFGTNFRLNPKKVLGLVFIEKGEGSTCEVLLTKIKNVLEGTKGIDGSKVVLILDELGSATQENSGYELGVDLLKSLSEKHISVLFSTQIMKLARYAEQELGGICYKFSPNHSMQKGIGDGGMDSLRERMGINGLLK